MSKKIIEIDDLNSEDAINVDAIDVDAIDFDAAFNDAITAAPGTDGTSSNSATHVLKEDVPVVSDRYVNIIQSYQGVFDQAVREYKPPVTRVDGQLCDEAKSIYKEDYYYDDTENCPQIGKDYNMCMENPGDTEKTTEILITRTSKIDEKAQKLQELRKDRRYLNLYYETFMNGISNMRNNILADYNTPYTAFFTFFERALVMIPKSKHRDFEETVCKVAAFLRYYRIPVDIRIFMNIFRCFAKGYPLERIVSIIVHGHSQLDFYNGHIVKCLKFNKKSNIAHLKQIKSSVDVGLSPIVCKDYMLIIGRYFTTFNDYINLSKVSTEYRDIIDIFRYNPIEDDYKFFGNKQTRVFHTKSDYINSGDDDFQILKFMYDVNYDEYRDYLEEHEDKDLLFKNVVANCRTDDEGMILDYNHYDWLKILEDKFVIDSCITKIKGGMFTALSDGITEVVLPDGLRSIPDSCFRHSSIETVTIPASVTSIDSYAFYECTMLTNVEFEGNNLVSIGEHAFSYSSITEIKIPEGVSVLHKSCFKYCYSLVLVELPTTLRSIKDRSFYEASLESIDIPDGVTKLGNLCFSGFSAKIGSFNVPSCLKRAKGSVLGHITVNDVYIPYTFEEINLKFIGSTHILNLHVRRPVTVSGTGVSINSTKIIPGSCRIDNIVYDDYSVADLIRYIESGRAESVSEEDEQTEGDMHCIDN